MLLATPKVSIGDFAPLFALLDQDEKMCILRDRAGSPTLLLFYAQDEKSTCQEIAGVFRDLMPTFEALGIQVFSISSDPPEARKKFAQDHNIPFRLLSDQDYLTSLNYGVCIPKTKEGDTFFTYSRTVFLLDENLRILHIYPLANFMVSMNQLLRDIKTRLPQVTPQYLTQQAPVLLIPNVLDPLACRHLIKTWETGGNDESGFMRREGEKTVGFIDYGHKRRRDHWVEDDTLLKYLDRVMRRRVFPEIYKAFNFEATRREAYKIACYDSSTGGYFRRHRDNTTGGTAHRKFAMTLNLNVEEYEGGYLRFPEYGPHVYKPDTGSVVIFGCSVLHEATDVTAGRRFALLSFFYGEEDAQRRQDYESRAQNDYDSIVKISS